MRPSAVRTTCAPTGAAALNPADRDRPLPRSCAVLPDACASVSGVCNVTPVPAAPDVPTVCTRSYSRDAPVSTAIASPTAMLVTLATLMFVAPAADAAASVVAVRGPVPTVTTERTPCAPYGSITIEDPGVI